LSFNKIKNEPEKQKQKQNLLVYTYHDYVKQEAFHSVIYCEVIFLRLFCIWGYRLLTAFLSLSRQWRQWGWGRTGQCDACGNATSRSERQGQAWPPVFRRFIWNR